MTSSPAQPELKAANFSCKNSSGTFSLEQFHAGGVRQEINMLPSWYGFLPVFFGLNGLRGDDSKDKTDFALSV